ncbi:Ubiquitin-conjugating enzyme E2 J1, partial [Nowakowskiella sp. JEL0078]
IGICLCDLTFGSCDPNCCCDIDCNFAQIEATFRGGCLESGASLPVIPICGENILIVNNAQKPGVSTSEDSNGVTCVLVNNSPIRGLFFDDPGTIRSYRFQISDNTGDPIQISLNGSMYPTTYLSHPYPSISSECNDLNPSKFLINQDTSCTRLISNPVESCSIGSVLDPSSYFDQISIVSDPSIPGAFAKVSVNSSICIDPITDDTVICSPGGINLDGSLCKNMLSRMTVSYFYNTTSNHSLKSITGGDIQNSTSFKRSGNPGYITGLPILAGTMAMNNSLSAILYSPDSSFGPTLSRDISNFVTPQISCTSPTDFHNRIPITFGEDIISGCSMYFTFKNLTSNCQAIRENIFKIQTLTIDSLTHVGRFGNSSYLNINEWIQIIKPSSLSVDGSVIITGTPPGRCDGVLSSLEIRFLTANFGSKGNPQKGIVGVQIYYNQGQFKFSCIRRNDCLMSSQNQQAFQVVSTVSWIDIPNQRAQMFIPPPPRLIPPLPDDIFYPFKLSHSNKSSKSEMSRSAAVKRLMKEYADLQSEPCPEFVAAPLESDIFEWHFTIRGPPEGGFSGGRYHGRIIFPADYPFKPPNISFLTPNGRFEIGKKICLSITGYHPEYWRPAWGVRLALVAIISFFPTKGEGAIGSLDYTDEERRIFSKKSRQWSCKICNFGKNEDLLPDESDQPTQKLNVDPEFTLTIRDQDEVKGDNASILESNSTSELTFDELSTNVVPQGGEQSSSSIADTQSVEIQDRLGKYHTTINPTLLPTVAIPETSGLIKRYHIDFALAVVLALLGLILYRKI